MAFDPTRLPRVAVLGDSRVFDTYYTNSRYGAARYGYHMTFPHRLRGTLLTRSRPVADLVHIPDHFRGGTVENNIIRLGLVDPWLVVLVDGIWESLIDKRHFLAHVRRQVESFDWRDGRSLDLRFDSRRMAELFREGAFDISPQRYAAKKRAILSHFTRRRRHVVVASIPVPPPDHLDRRHHAGDYLVIPEWGEVLDALNRAVAAEVETWGAETLDLDGLMRRNGGAARCLLDQWHFSPDFHGLVADALEAIVDRHSAGGTAIVPAPMLPGDPPGSDIVLAGEETARAAFRRRHPDLRVASECPAEAPHAVDSPAVVLAMSEGDARDAAARAWLAATGDGTAVLYAEEVAPLHNPPGQERDQHGALSGNGELGG